ncbi:hypothetical protein ERX46_06440 [Brumimicrobium glaciale]|uniref:Outer membrane porin, OprD family n=1 Tax=Brumimicrobium glaciale TaxID=200475 RepID=A0A4Q4KQ50_9FLAO|nr:hypothetical protein [Brumimicrobium glaciale]RYM35007.1 hypothetical protein ERX46_06440 [Brumimicrobium glaciale]
MSIKLQNLIIHVIILLAFAFPFQGFGQDDSLVKSKGLRDFLKKGELNFLSKTQLMSTVNEGAGNDFFALGTGIGAFYKTPSFHGFQVKAGAFMTFNLAGYNLVNSTTNKWNNTRYEKALYDIKDPSNKYNLGALDELYLAYTFKKLSFKVGRQIHETPLLNKNYNRFRPNIFQGLSAKYENKKLTFSAAWFISEAIRGTMNTYSTANSFGVYSEGWNPDGSKNDYHGHIKTLGTGVFGVKYKHKNTSAIKWESQAWNYLGENVFNLTFVQSDFKIKHKKTEFLFGVQGLYQTALNNGGNPNPTHAYILNEESTYAVGGKVGVKFIQQHEISLNYFGISDEGRYLFPREWGREQFYASQTTELFEGYGGLNAYVFRYEYSSKNKRHSTKLSAGIIDQPDIQNLRLNKYGLDNYYHFLAQYKHQFGKYFEGLSMRFIVTYKKEMNPGSMTSSQKINKVDMMHFNLTLNYFL